MRKRTKAMLGAAVAAVVMMTGLTGSALADQGDDRPIVCTTSDGKTFEVKPGIPVTIQDGKGMDATITITKATEASPAIKGEAKAIAPEGAVNAVPLEKAELSTFSATDIKDAEAVATTEAVPATPIPDGEAAPVSPMETVSIKCEPTE